MNPADALFEALALPPDSRVDERIAKRLLAQHGARAAGERKRVEEGIAEAHWLAALRGGEGGLAAFRDDTREYAEIHVLRLILRPDAAPAPLLRVVHRAIPYPIVILCAQGDTAWLSLAPLRRAENEPGRLVLESDPVTTPPLRPTALSPVEREFLARLALASQAVRDLYQLYQAWIDHLGTLDAAGLTGALPAAQTPAQAAQRRALLAEFRRLQADITRLRREAAKERQINRQVELNLQLQRLEARAKQCGAMLA
jgi:hypothetical protein